LKREAERDNPPSKTNLPADYVNRLNGVPKVEKTNAGAPHLSSGIGIHAKARSSLKLGFLRVFLAEAISGQGKSLGGFLLQKHHPVHVWFYSPTPGDTHI